MKKFLKYFLIFLFSISFFSYADSPENIRRHEARLQNHKNLSSADLQKIVKVLREYYIREKKDNELEKMNSLLLRVFSRTERQQELLKLLLELENISCSNLHKNGRETQDIVFHGIICFRYPQNIETTP